MGSYPYPITDEDWTKLGEYVVTHREDLSPELVGELTSEATGTIFAHYNPVERAEALKKRASARNTLMDLAELKTYEAVSGRIARREEGAIRYIFGSEAYKEDWGWGRGKGFCWTITDYGLGEIAESAQKYTSIDRAMQGAKASVERSRAISTGPFLVQIFDEPPVLDPSVEKTTRSVVYQKTW